MADTGGGSNPAMAPHPVSLAIYFEFDIRPREVRPSIRCFFVFALNKTLAYVTIDSQENY